MISTQDLNTLNKRSDVSILFSDIRGFTTLSEKLSPEDVVALLNPYLEAMSKVIYKHGGTVDKYEGDAIIAFFGEPVPYKDHAARALRASLDMRKALVELKEKWAKEGRPVRSKWELASTLVGCSWGCSARNSASTTLSSATTPTSPPVCRI